MRPGYDQRLSELNLPSLEQRKRALDLILFLKFLNGKFYLTCQPFQFNNRAHRGRTLTLYKKSFNTTAFQHFWTNRVVNDFNKLPDDLLQCYDLDQICTFLNTIGSHGS